MGNLKTIKCFDCTGKINGQALQVGAALLHSLGLSDSDGPPVSSCASGPDEPNLKHRARAFPSQQLSSRAKKVLMVCNFWEVSVTTDSDFSLT